MGSLFSGPPKPDPGLAARQAEAQRKAAEEAEKERQRLEEETRAAALGLRGRRAFLSEAGEQGFAAPTTLGGV